MKKTINVSLPTSDGEENFVLEVETPRDLIADVKKIVAFHNLYESDDINCAIPTYAALLDIRDDVGDKVKTETTFPEDMELRSIAVTKVKECLKELLPDDKDSGYPYVDTNFDNIPF